MLKPTLNQLRSFLLPLEFVPTYQSLAIAGMRQRESDTALLRSVSVESLKEGDEIDAEFYNELREEASRLVKRELKLTESAKTLHSNAIRFGLVAAGIVASLGAWLNLQLVWMPLVAFIFSVAAAWWFLCQQEPDWNAVLESWSQNMLEKVGDSVIPERLKKEMYLHIFERRYYLAVRDYRQWLHRRLAVPSSLFVVGLIMLLVSVAVSH